MNREQALQISQLESERPGWKQLQRSGTDWLALQVQLGKLKRLDLAIWLIVAGRASLRNGVAWITIHELADYLGYQHWDVPADALQRLQRVGALLRLEPGRYLVNPALLRSGGVGRAGSLFRFWRKAWSESRWAEDRVEPEDPRVAKAEYDRKRYARLQAERQAAPA